jgi:hypothetical protein
MAYFPKFLAVVVFLFASYNALGQVTTPLPSQQDRVFQGTLIEVDTNAKTLMAKGADNNEMMFHYTNNTEIIGSESTAQALAQKAGSTLSITYNVDEAGNIATRIEF